MKKTYFLQRECKLNFKLLSMQKGNARFTIFPLSYEVFGRYCNFSRFKNVNADNSCSRNAQLTFVEKPQKKKMSFQNYKH